MITYSQFINEIKPDRRLRRYAGMEAHRAEWLWDVSKGQIVVKFGLINATFTNTDEVLWDVESALIFDNKPSEKDNKKKSYTIVNDLIVKIVNHRYLLNGTVDTRNPTG